MPRLLPLCALLLGATAAQAQQVELLAAALPDTTALLPTLPINGRATATLAPTIQDQLRTVAGVQVTPVSGAPGAGVVLRLRGPASYLYPVQPLYVVDELPTTVLNFAPSYHANGQNSPILQIPLEFNPLLLLPAEALDSVAALTGPLDASHYGMQGAGGILSLQTARGTADAPLRVTYSAQATLQQLRRRYDLLGAREYAELANEAAVNNRQPILYTPEYLAGLGQGTDWQDELYRTGLGTDHRVQLSGGGSTTGYAAHAGYFRQAGVMRNSSLARYHAGATLNQQLHQKLVLRASLLGSQLNERRPTEEAVGAALLSAPNLPVRDANGLYFHKREQPFSQPPAYLQNPVWLAENRYHTPRTRLLLTRLSATYMPTPAWEIGLRGGYDEVTQRSPEYSSLPTSMDDLFPDAQRSGLLSSRVRTVAAAATVRFQQRFGTAHQVTASAQYLYQRLRYVGSREYSFIDAFFPVISYQTNKGRQEDCGGSLHTQVIKAAYTLHDAYEWQASVTVSDIHSPFGSVPAVLYPAGQFTWKAEQLPALQGLSWLSELRLWAGAGQSAVGQYEAYGYLSGIPVVDGPVMESQMLGPITPTDLAALGRIDNPERTTLLELGTTLGLWQQRLRLGATVYQRQSRNLMVPMQAYYQGTPSLAMGRGLDMTNRGLELALEASWQAGRVTATTRLAAATNANRIDQRVRALPLQQSRVQPGYPLGAYFGNQQVGIFPVRDPQSQQLQYPGSIHYAGYEPRSRPMGTPQPLGSGLPKHTLTLVQRAQYGRFAIDVQLDAMGGYDIFAPVLATLEIPSGYTNSSPSVRDRWTPANPNTNTPQAGIPARAAQGVYPLVTSRQLKDGSHLRLTEAVLSYRLPTALPITLYGGGRNLLVATRYLGYDPNVSSAGAFAYLPNQDTGAYPVPRTWLLGVRATL